MNMHSLAHPFYRIAASRFSRAGPSAKLSILIFHRVLAQTDPLFPSEATLHSFDWQMALVKSLFNVLPLPEAVSRLKSGSLPARAAAITFDDGYADNYTHALPILKKHGLHATFFIATAYLDGGRMFNDTVIECVRNTRLARLDLSDMQLGQYELGSIAAKKQAIHQILPKIKYLLPDEREVAAAQVASRAEVESLPNDLMMTTAQLQSLHAAGMEVGGHTHRHPILARLDRDAARSEIATGKTVLEDKLGTRVSIFAYPNGKPGTDYLPEQASIVREVGFDAAVSTSHGVSTRNSDMYQLARFTPWDAKPTAYAMRLLQNLATGKKA